MKYIKLIEKEEYVVWKSVDGSLETISIKIECLVDDDAVISYTNPIYQNRVLKSLKQKHLKRLIKLKINL